MFCESTLLLVEGDIVIMIFRDKPAHLSTPQTFQGKCPPSLTHSDNRNRQKESRVAVKLKIITVHIIILILEYTTFILCTHLSGNRYIRMKMSVSVD